MQITKLFSKLRLVENWQFGRGKREAVTTENRNFFLFPYNLAFFSHVWLFVIWNNNFPLKISNPMTFSNLMYLEKWSVILGVCQTRILEGCHKSRQAYIYLPSWQPPKKFTVGRLFWLKFEAISRLNHESLCRIAEVKTYLSLNKIDFKVSDTTATTRSLA